MRRQPEREADAGGGGRDEQQALAALLALARLLGRPKLLRENEVARRCFVEPGLAALCHVGHPAQEAVDDHVRLFQALDWPRADGASLAEGVAEEAARLAEVDADSRRLARVTAAVANARLRLVRVTARGGSRVRLEDLVDGSVLAGNAPELRPLDLGECAIARFLELGEDRLAAASDLLLVAPGGEARVQELALGPLPRRSKDEVSGRATLLFRAWTAVAFGDADGRVNPAEHLGRIPPGARPRTRRDEARRR